MKYSLLLALVCCLLVGAQDATAQINLSFSSVPPSCHGSTNGSATVTPGGGTEPYSYHWANGQTSPTIQGIGAGTFAVTVTDVANHMATGSVTVTEPGQLLVDVDVMNILCADHPDGGAVNAVISGGTNPYTVVWNDGNTDRIRANLPAGNYSVTATDAHGCTAADQGTITIPSPLVAAVVSVTPSCGGGNNGAATIFVAGGTPPYTHTWDPGGYTGTTVTGLAPGVYYVCTFDANHCQKDLWVTIPQIPNLDVTLVVQSAECTGVNNGTVTAIVDPPGNYTYDWNLPPYHGVTELTGLAANTVVSVTVTDPVSGCSGTATTTVGAHSAITLTVTDTDIPCAGQNLGTAHAVAVGGTPAYQYQWFLPPSGPGIGVGPDITGLAAGAYLVSVTDAHGCTAMGAANIGILSAPMAVIGNSTAVACDSVKSTIQFVNLSTDAYSTIASWVWTIITPTDTLTFSNISPINLTLPVGVTGTAQLVVTSATGCTATAIDTFKVQGLPQIHLNVGPVVMVCDNTPVNLIVTGGHPWYSYVWSPLTGLTLDSIPPNAVANPDSTTTYQLIASDHGCMDTVSVTIIRKNPIELSVPDSTIVTCDSTVLLLATSNVPNVIWIDSTGAVLGNNPVTVVAGATAIYTAIATDSLYGCVDSLQVSVTGLPGFHLTIDTVLVDCDNPPVPIHVHGTIPGLTYVWSPTTGLTFDPVPPNVIADPDSTTTYQLIASNLLGCADTVSVTVIRVTPIELSVPDSTIVTCESTILLLATSNVSNVIWVDAAGNVLGNNPVTVTPGATAIYTAIATDSLYGCVDSLQVSVTGLPGLDLSIDSVAIDCNNGPVTLTVHGAVPGLTYMWTPTTGLTFDPNSPNVIADPDSTTTYQLIAKNDQWCMDTVSVTVIRVVPIELSVPDTVIVTCESTILLLATSNVTNVIWVDAAGNVLGNNPVTVTPGATAIYTAIATDSLYGCVDSLQVSVTGLPGLDLSIDSVVVDCNNGPVTLTVHGIIPGLTYMWTPTTGLTFDPNSPNVIADPDSTTTYQLIAKNDQWCMDTVSVTVIRVIPIELSVPDTVIVTCESTVLLLATSNVSNVIWVDAAGNVLGNNPVTVTPGATAIYTAIATDSLYGCVDSLQVSVTGLPGLDLSIDSVAVDCNNGPVTLTVHGAVPGLTYMWTPTTGLTFDPNSPNVIADPDSTTTYQLIAKNDQWCMDTVSVTVIRVIPIELSVPDTVIVTCESTILLLATSNVSNVIWVDAAGNVLGNNPVTVTPGATAIYTAIATDSLYGCVDSLQVSVTGLPGLDLSIDSVAVDCNNGPVTLTVHGAVPGLTYMWTPTTGLTFDPNSPNVIADPDSTTTYQLIAKNDQWCMDTVSVTVIRVIPIELSVPDSTIVTCDSTVLLLATSNVPNVIWIDSTGAVLGNNPVVVVAGATAIYTAIATDSLYGCVDSLQVSVTGLPGFHLSIDSIIVDCNNGPVPIHVHGTIPGLTYVWTPTTGLTFDPVPPNVIADPDSTTTYQLIASNLLGCADTVSVTVIRVIPIELSVPDTVIVTCESTVLLLATSNVPNVIWVDAAGNVLGNNPITVTPGATAIYTAIATDSLYGCVDSLQVSVTGLPGLDLSIDSVVVDCNNGPVTLTVHGIIPGLTYMWTPTTGLTFDPNSPNVIADPDSTTTYQLIAKNDQWCMDTVSVTVIRVIPIELSVPDTVIVTCESTVLLLATSNVPNVIWVDAAGNVLGNNPITVTPGATAIYTAIATDSLYGCVDSLQVSVTGLPGLDLSIDSVVVDCNNGPVTLTVHGIIPGLTYMWTPTTGLTFDPNSPNVIADPDSTTTYQLIAKNDQWCMDTVSVTVIRVVPIELSVPDTVIVTCESTVLLLATSNVPNVIWVDAAGNVLGNNPITVTPGATAIYTAIATDSLYGCVDSLQVSVTGLPGLDLSIDSVVVDCNNGPVTLTVHGIIPGLTYMWTPTTGLTFDPNSPNVIADPDSTTTYQLIAKNDQWCMDTVSVTVIRVVPIELSVPDTVIVTCESTVLLLATSNVPNVIWVDAAGNVLGNNPVTVTPGATAIYTAIATDSLYGCVDSLQVSVTGMSGLGLSLDSVIVDCNNGPVPLVVHGAVPGIMYVWTPTTGLTFDPNSPNVIANPDSTTTYQLIAKNAQWCMDTLSVTVIRVTPIELSVPDSVIVTCDSTVLLLATSNVPNVIWIDSTGAVLGNNPVIVVAGTTAIYWAIATDTLYHCVDSLQVSVTGVGVDVSVDPTIPTVICEGMEISLGLINHHPGDTLQYQWTVTPPMVIVGATTGTPVISGPAGNYNVTVTVANQFGCPDTLVIPIHIQESQSIAQDLTVDLCNGLTVSFFNASQYDGVWTFGDGDTSIVKNPIHNYNIPGLYHVTFTAAGDCITPWDSMINVQQAPLLPPVITYNYTNCIDNAEILFSGSSDAHNVTWSWKFSSGTPDTSSLQNQAVVFTEEDTITAILVITDVNGCHADTMERVPVFFIRDSIVDALSFCIDTTVQLNANGFDSTATYVWTAVPFDSTLVSTDKNPTVSPNVQTVYSVTISQGTTCSITYQVTVTPLDGVHLQAQNDTIVCSDAQIFITASGNGLGYEWSTSITFDSIFATGASVPIIPDTNGIYYVRSSSIGCAAMDSVKVKIKPFGIQPLPFDGNICAGGETVLQVTNLTSSDSVLYTWTPSLPSDSTVSVSPTQTTTYTVIATNQNHCKDTVDFVVHVTNIHLHAEVTGDNPIHVGESTGLLATTTTNGVLQSLEWTPPNTLSDPSIPNPIATPDSEQVYVVTAITTEGCIDSDQVIVRIISGECVEPYIFVPKAFTPNNDSNNDFFIVKGVNITELSFIVWDRWGEKVYQTNDPHAQGWDGTYNGKELTPDSYAWYIHARCGNGMVYEKKGDVTLLK